MTIVFNRRFLSGRTFAYGPIGMPPWTKVFRLREDGNVAGYIHSNERFWEVKDAALLIFNDHRDISVVFDSIDTASEQVKLLGRTDQCEGHNVSLYEEVAPRYDLASLVLPSATWDTRSKIAVFVRSVSADEKFTDLVLKLRQKSDYFDIFGLIDQTHGVTSPPKGIDFVPFSESMARQLGFSQKKSLLFYDLGDLSFYFALRERPGYRFYIFLDDDVDFVETDASLLSELVQLPGFEDADFIGLMLHDQNPNVSWGPASVKRFGERFCKYCYYPFVCLSKRALSFMFSQRQVEAASNLPEADLVQCESFTPSSLQAAGFNCLDLGVFIPGCYDVASVMKQLTPNRVGSPMGFKAKSSPGIRLLHPVYTPEEYLKRVERKFITIRNNDLVGLVEEIRSEEFLSLPKNQSDAFISYIQERYNLHYVL